MAANKVNEKRKEKRPLKNYKLKYSLTSATDMSSLYLKYCPLRREGVNDAIICEHTRSQNTQQKSSKEKKLLRFCSVFKTFLFVSVGSLECQLWRD